MRGRKEEGGGEERISPRSRGEEYRNQMVKDHARQREREKKRKKEKEESQKDERDGPDAVYWAL